MYEQLATPAVIVDLNIAESNIGRMAAALRARGIRHRPHIKSHKSVDLARKQMEAGAIGITVAKLSEAEVFVRGGIDDILVAYPIVGRDKLDRFARLHEQARMVATVDSLAVAEGLSEVGMRMQKPVDVLIEIDGGLHRGGVQPGQDALDFARSIRGLPGLRIRGIMGYFGTIYRHPNGPELVEAAKREASVVRATAELLRSDGFDIEIVSSGSSPAALMAEHLDRVTEVRAGNYIFFDASGIGLGLAEERDCALRVIATVVSAPLPGKATIDAGTKTLTSDKAHRREGFGCVVGRPDIRIVGLNEEHGFLEYDPATVRLQVGDRIEIIPNHSCVVPNLAPVVTGIRNGQIVGAIPIDARGCNY
ncbi:amino acid processing protein [Paenibacillus mesophilus]|uniref:alanine racemase n=1 Tax=Paenibacillus mesophilus TaxID=2582849 RepID=UPI00110EA5A0|nr:alanine racemase [Paenibacillus mesophilus]TMV52906.1 amino acid processing protein [Paenibacillus mesophilus]